MFLKLYAVLFWILFIAITVLHFLILAIHRLMVGRPPDFDRIAHRYGTSWAKWTLRCGPKWVVETPIHREKLTQQACVLVCNHSSMTDIWVLFLLDTQFRWLSKIEVFQIPVIGTAMRWAGYIPVRRGDKSSHIQALQSSADCLRRGISMLFFPEGTRSETGEMRPFKAGAFKLAMEERVAIQPVVLVGADKLIPKGSAVPHPAKVRMQILDPVWPHDGEDVQAFADRVREQMVKAQQVLGTSPN